MTTQWTRLDDPVADLLDDMALIGVHWTRNRENGRMPNGIRSAMMMIARDLVAMAEMQEKEFQKLFAAQMRPPSDTPQE